MTILTILLNVVGQLAIYYGITLQPKQYVQPDFVTSFILTFSTQPCIKIHDPKSPVLVGFQVLSQSPIVMNLLYFVILLGRFPLVGKIKKIFGHFFHIIEVQKVISRNFSISRGRRPREMEEVSRNHFLNQDNMEQMVKQFRNFFNKCMKTIQVMQQTIFFYFGIDL